jgi:thioredoxin-like negative regulator of GroEL
MTINRHYYRALLEDQFDETILTSEKGYQLVAFNNGEYALNEIYDDILEQVAKEFKNKVLFYRVDSSSSITLVDKMGINSIPVVYIYRKGEVIKTFVGIYARTYLIKTLRRIVG